MPVNVCLFASDIYGLRGFKGTKKVHQQWNFIAPDTPVNSMWFNLCSDNPGIAVKQ